MKKLFLLIFGSVTLSQPFPFVSNVSHKTADMGWKPLGKLEGIRVNNRKQGVVSIETAVRTHTDTYCEIRGEEDPNNGSWNLIEFEVFRNLLCQCSTVCVRVFIVRDSLRAISTQY